jgi:hypothetical protein
LREESWTLRPKSHSGYSGEMDGLQTFLGLKGYWENIQAIA